MTNPTVLTVNTDKPTIIGKVRLTLLLGDDHSVKFSQDYIVPAGSSFPLALNITAFLAGVTPGQYLVNVAGVSNNDVVGPDSLSYPSTIEVVPVITSAVLS